jgi:hypothetical protein
MWSLLVDALSLALLAVGGVLTAVRVALWAALFLRGSEPPPAPRNTPLRRTKGEGDPPPPKNERTRPRDDGDALKRYATVARERRGYAALVTATFLMALVLGGCGFLPPAVRTTHIQTPTLSGENARIEATEVGGVISDVRTFVPPAQYPRLCAVPRRGLHATAGPDVRPPPDRLLDEHVALSSAPYVSPAAARRRRHGNGRPRHAGHGGLSRWAAIQGRR